MSLIQEALKRKLEEQQGVAAQPPLVSATPPKSSADGSAKGGAFGRILGFFIALILLLSVAVSLFYLAAKKWNWKDAMAEAKSDAGQARQKWELKLQEMKTEKPEPTPAVVTSAPAEAKEPGIVAPANPLTNVREHVADMKGKVVAYENEHAEVVTGAPAAAPAAVPPKQEPAAVPAAAPGAVTEAKEEGAKPGVLGFFKRDDEPKKGGPWPKITVNGILSGGGKGGGAAIINNRMVSVNELVEGAKVMDVQAKGVLMEYKGETRLLLIGQTSE